MEQKMFERQLKEAKESLTQAQNIVDALMNEPDQADLSQRVVSAARIASQAAADLNMLGGALRYNK
jgi:hypothetical protein